jgi:hypothetical protein
MRTKLFEFALFILVSSVLFAAPTAAIARAQKTAVSGDQQATVSGPPGSVRSAGKWTIITTAPLTAKFAFSGDGVSFAGTLTRVVDVRIDAALNGTLRGTVSYVDTNMGVTCTGHHEGKLTNNFFTGKVVAPCSDGSLLQGTLQDTKLTYDQAGNLIAVESHFTGTLLNPHG